MQLLWESAGPTKDNPPDRRTDWSRAARRSTSSSHEGRAAPWTAAGCRSLPACNGAFNAGAGRQPGDRRDCHEPRWLEGLGFRDAGQSARQLPTFLVADRQRRVPRLLKDERLMPTLAAASLRSQAARRASSIRGRRWPITPRPSASSAGPISGTPDEGTIHRGDFISSPVRGAICSGGDRRADGPRSSEGTAKSRGLHP